MQRYIRMAGIEEQGATEALNLLTEDRESPQSPTPRPVRKRAFHSVPDTAKVEEEADHLVMDKVVQLFTFKKRQ